MITYKDIITAAQGIRNISKLNLKISEAVKLAKLIKKLDEEAELYYELRQKLCKQYGEYEAEKDRYYIPDENREEMNSKLRELDNTEVSIEKLKLSVDGETKLDTVTLISVENIIEIIVDEE